MQRFACLKGKIALMNLCFRYIYENPVENKDISDKLYGLNMQSTLFRISNEEAEAAADLIVPNLIENIVLQYHRSDLLSPPKMDGGGADWYARTHYNKVVVIDGVEYGNYPYNPKYGYLKGIDKKTGQTYNEDCTNFASQILFEGGKVPMSYKGVGDEGPDLGHIPGMGKDSAGGGNHRIICHGLGQM